MTGENVNQVYRSTAIKAFEENTYRIEDATLREYLRDTLNVTPQAVGQILRYMREDGLIELTGTVWRMKSTGAPLLSAELLPPPPPAPSSNGRINIAEFYRERQGKRVEVIRGRQLYNDVFRIEYMLHASGHWLKFPIWVDPVLYIGEMVDVDPEQEVLTDVRKLRIVFTNGTYEEIEVGAKDYVTIAPASED